MNFYKRNIILFKLFVKFLKKNNALDSFLKNFLCARVTYYSKSPIYFAVYNEDGVAKNDWYNASMFNGFSLGCFFISLAFNWDETNEGSDYWAKIETKWLFLCEKLGIAKLPKNIEREIELWGL